MAHNTLASTKQLFSKIAMQEASYAAHRKQRTVTLVSVTPTVDALHTVVLSDGVHTITVRGVGAYMALKVAGYGAEELARLFAQYDAVVTDMSEYISKAAV